MLNPQTSSQNQSRQWVQVLHPAFNLFTWGYWFGMVDMRPASVFRIVFALLLLKVAFYRLFIADLFYSDTGILPRTIFWNPANPYRFSVMDAMPETWMAQAFFLLWMIVLLCLLIGYRSRLMAILNLVIILSIHDRNPMILNGADTVMRVLSFWLVFLATDRYYSLDAIRFRWRRFLRSRNPGDLRVETEARTGFALPLRLIQIQIALIYLMTFLHKIVEDVWLNGEAVWWSLQLKTYALPTGDWAFENIPFLIFQGLDYFTLFIEGAFILLVFSPFFQPLLRMLGLLMGVFLHLGIGFLQAIPDFSAVMIFSYSLLLLPNWVTSADKVLRRKGGTLRLPPPGDEKFLWWLLSITKSDEIIIDEQLETPNETGVDSWQIYDQPGKSYQGLSAWRQIAAHMPLSRLWAWILRFRLVRSFIWHLATWRVPSFNPIILTNEVPPPSFGQRRISISNIILSIVLIFCMFLVVWHNLFTVKINDQLLATRVTPALTPFLEYTGLSQGWKMFKRPPRQIAWFVVKGQFANGKEINLVTGHPPDDAITRTFWGPGRWRKYWVNLMKSDNKRKFFNAWGGYYCNTHNPPGTILAERLVSLEIIRYFQPSHALDEEPKPIQSQTMWQHQCFRRS